MNKSISDSQLMDVDKQFMVGYAIDHRHGKSYRSNLFHVLSQSQVAKEEVISPGTTRFNQYIPSPKIRASTLRSGWR